MNYTDILRHIAETLNNADNVELENTRERVQVLLITEDEREALIELIDAALYSIAMATS